MNEKQEFEVKVVDLSEFRDPSSPYNRLSKKVIMDVADYVNESRFEYPGPGGYLSASFVGQFLRCPRASMYAKFERIPFRPSIKMSAGNGVHKGLEFVYNSKKMGMAIHPDEVIMSGITEFKDRVNNDDIREKDGGVEAFQKDVGKYTDHIAATLNQYCVNREYDKLGKVEGVEEEFMVLINGIPIYGFTDLVTEDSIIDFKFSTRDTSSLRIKSLPSDMQLFLYEMRFNKPGEFHLLTAPPKKTPKEPKPLVRVLKKTDYLTWPMYEFVETLEQICESIDQGYFPRRGLTYDGCGDCQYKDDCLRPCKFSKIAQAETIKVEVEKDGLKKTITEYKQDHYEEAKRKAEEKKKAEAEKAQVEEKKPAEQQDLQLGASVPVTPKKRLVRRKV